MLPLSMDKRILGKGKGQPSLYSWVQKDKGPAKWMVMGIRGKEDTVVPLKIGMVKEWIETYGKMKKDGKGKKFKAHYDTLTKADEEQKDDESKKLMVISPHEPKDAASSKDIEAYHLKMFTDVMKAEAKATNPTLGVLDFKKKIFYVTLCSDDTVGVKKKMKFSGIREKLKTALDGVQKNIQATDNDELDYTSFEEAMAKI